MGEITHMTPEDFLKETQRWGLNSSSMIKVRMMKKDDMLICRIPIPNTAEFLQTEFPADWYKEFGFMVLNHISTPGVFDEDPVKKTEQLLNQVNQLVSRQLIKVEDKG